MARLKITIEGEMSPEEVKRYIVAAWAGLPHEVAVSEVDLDAPTGTSKVPPPPAPVEPEPNLWLPPGAAPAVTSVKPAPTPEPFAGKAVQEHAEKAEDSLVKALCTHKKLSDVLQEIVDQTGTTELSGIIEVCRTLQTQVPILERLGAGLEDRVTRTWTMML